MPAAAPASQELPLSFRPSTKADVPLIMQMLREAAKIQHMEDEFFTTDEVLEREIFGPVPKANIHLIEKDGETAGMTVFFFNFASFIGCSGVYVEDIYVRPKFQGKGIGTQIFEYLARYALEQGCGLLEWLVADGNVQARGFYKKMGAYSADGWTVHRMTGETLKKVAAQK